MNQKHCMIDKRVEVVPLAWNKAENKYGSVEGLDEDELASPQELEKIYYKELWGPILLLPRKKSYNSIWDVSADVDYNAFASVDFDRMRPAFNTAKYKRDKIKERVKDLVIMMKIVSERIKDIRKYKVLRLVGKGLLDADDIQHGDLWQLALMYKRTLRLKKEMARLQEVSRKKQLKASEKWLESLG